MSERQLDRQQFLQAITRGGLMASLAGFGIAAVHGSRTVEECFNHNYCDSCWQFDGCALPEKKEIPNERVGQSRSA